MNLAGLILLITAFIVAELIFGAWVDWRWQFPKRKP